MSIAAAVNEHVAAILARSVYRSESLYERVLDAVEPPLLTMVMCHCGWNQSRAAEMLGMNRATLRKKLRRHRISTRQRTKR